MISAVDTDSLARDSQVQANRCLRILLASWAPFHAGAEVAAERLAVALRDDGHQVTVVVGTEGETLRRMQESGLDVRHVPLALTDKFRWWRYARAQHELRCVLRDARPDIVHANDLPTSQMVSQAAGQLGIPRVCHHRWIFDGVAIDWLNKFGAEKHLFVSQALLDRLCGASRRLASSPKAVVYDGLPLPAVPSVADRVAAREKLGLPSRKAIVLFAGQIIERKGVDDLLQAWSLLNPELRQRSDLILLGDDLENHGAYRRRMETRATELGLAIRFMGYRRDVSQWLLAADVCVVPSHEEPLGNATLEAMAYARPVLGSDVGGIPEMVVHESTGLLVPPKAPAALAGGLEQLLRDDSARAELGANGRRRCERLFSLRAHVDSIVDVYRQVLVNRLVESAG